MSTQTNEVEHIAVMHVDFHISRQPEAYNNVRCGVSLPVFVRPHDDHFAILDETLAELRYRVQEEVNLQFESYEYAAPYGDEPRYNLLRVPQEPGIYAILPHEVRPNGWDEAVKTEGQPHRAGYLQLKCQTEYHPDELYDASAGLDFRDLPLLETVWRYRSEQNQFYFIVGKEQPKPDDLKEKYGWLGASRYTALAESILMVVEATITEKDWPLYDCRDGDFSKLPAPKVEEEPEDELPFDDDLDASDSDDDEWED